MIQIIERKEGHKSVKRSINDGQPQISYNDWGHICIRIIHDDESDTLVVLDQKTSSRMLNFIRRNDLPF